MKTNTIVIAGAGPAGLMAAIRAGQLGQRVILLEKKPTPGNKLLLSGKGRCNLTNTSELEHFLKRFSKGGEFLRDSFKKFFNSDLVSFLDSRGLKTKVERQQRVFPATDSSKSVLDVLSSELNKNKVEAIYNAQLKDIIVDKGKVKQALLASGKLIACDRLILATGGVSFPQTGSSGEGLKIAEKLGHKIVGLKPGLVPLKIKEDYPKKLEGLTLKNIRLTFVSGKKKIESETGELLFTGFGVSGPLVLSLSGRVIDLLKAGEGVFLDIDLKPGLSQKQLDDRLLREFKAGAKKSLKNILKELAPSKLAALCLEILKIDADKQSGYVTQEERKKLLSFFKGFRLQVKDSLPIEYGMVTRGGVSLKEIDPRSMQSRLVKGLFFAGEMIDVDADTGGFNLQAAFSTGYLAGESASL